jgi:hypothetical protein
VPILHRHLPVLHLLELIDLLTDKHVLLLKGHDSKVRNVLLQLHPCHLVVVDWSHHAIEGV